MTGPSVAFPGEFGAFSDEAILAFFDSTAISVPHGGPADVCDTVENGVTDYGLLPIENSGVGSVAGCYDVLAARDLFVVGEIVRPIRHCLVGSADAVVSNVRRVLSHPMALAQCAEFLKQNPLIQTVAASDTASAAKQVAESNDATVAAIAGHRTVERYGLELLARDIHDQQNNETRFLVIAKDPERITFDDNEATTKTIAVFETADEPGALVNALVPFSERGINLSKIESRPASRPWAYRFFIEIETHDQACVEDAIVDARACTKWFRVLGSFWPGVNNTVVQNRMGRSASN